MLKTGYSASPWTPQQEKVRSSAGFLRLYFVCYSAAYPQEHMRLLVFRRTWRNYVPDTVTCLQLFLFRLWLKSFHQLVFMMQQKQFCLKYLWILSTLYGKPGDF